MAAQEAMVNHEGSDSESDSDSGGSEDSMKDGGSTSTTGRSPLVGESSTAHVTYHEWNKLTKKGAKSDSQGFTLFTSKQTRTCKAPVYHTWRVWFILVGIGVGTGLIAAGVDKGLESMFDFRMYLNDMTVHAVGQGSSGVWLQYLEFSAVAVALASVAGFLVCFQAPLAAGSGIPEIKCYLNGIVVSRVVSNLTLIAKAVGIVFSASSGLPVGKEGPMIHSGAVIGGIASKLTIRLRNSSKREQPLSLNSERRDIVAAGATAGVAAAFGAPMGACLFAIEEGTSHMSPRILLKLFVAASCAAFVSRFFTALTCNDISEEGVLGSRVPVFLLRFEKLDYAVWELPIFALIGIIGGLCGALFNYMNKLLTLKRKVWMPAPQLSSRGRVIVQRRDFLRFGEVLFVTFVISSLHFWIPMSLRSEPTSLEDLSQTEKLFWQTGTAALRSLLHDGRVEPQDEDAHMSLSNATRASLHNVTQRLLSGTEAGETVEGDFDLRMLGVFIVMHLTTTCWTYGLGVPSGLFVPSLCGGAAVGRFIGQIMPFNVATPGVYALIGATAMLAGAARITISLAMILMEVTGEAGFSLPIFMVVMVARWTGNHFGRGIYDLHIVELKHVPLLEHDPEDCMVKMQAKEIMATQPVSILEVESVGALCGKLGNCTHNAFPVVREGRLVGMVTRDQLHYLIHNGEKHKLFGEDPKIIQWSEMGASLAQKRDGLPQSLSAEMSMRDLDLRPYLSKDYHVMSENACVFSCYNVFRQMGLRHLFIISESDGKLCGVITRKNLILMEHEDVEDMKKCEQREVRNAESRRRSSSENSEGMAPIGSMTQGFGGIAGL